MENTLQRYLQNPNEFHRLVQAAVAGDGTVLPEVRALLEGGSSLSDAVMPLTSPQEAYQLALIAGE